MGAPGRAGGGLHRIFRPRPQRLSHAAIPGRPPRMAPGSREPAGLGRAAGLRRHLCRAHRALRPGRAHHDAFGRVSLRHVGRRQLLPDRRDARRDDPVSHRTHQPGRAATPTRRPISAQARGRIPGECDELSPHPPPGAALSILAGQSGAGLSRCAAPYLNNQQLLRHGAGHLHLCERGCGARRRHRRGRHAGPPPHLPVERAWAAYRAGGARFCAGRLQMAQSAPAAALVMTERIEADICVIGAGSGGLSVAAGASQLGMKTVLIERGAMGGDCLNTGCVPSKSLLAAARRVHAARLNGAFGLSDAPPTVDFPAVMRHVQEVIAAIAPHDSVERFEGMGVQVIAAQARFTGPREVTAGGQLIQARRFVIATGSSPAVPPIPGIDTVPFLTNETVFQNTTLPRHLIVIGAGPVGLEMAQAHRLLGAEVTVLEAAKALSKDDPELAELLLQRLRADGITVEEGVKIRRVERSAGGVTVTIEGGAGERRLQGSHLLVAAGRRANLADLGLETAGIERDERGALIVDRGLRTTNPRVYATGDAAGGPQFTHVAGYHAGIVIRRALFRLPAKVDYRALPRVTYTDPELAQAGMTESEAREAHGGDLQVLRWSFHENDRAQAERETHGLVKAVARRNGRILGASIIGAHAGELIQLWGLAIGRGLKLSAIANMIAPYPTFGEVSKRAAGSFYTPKLFSERTRRLVRLLARLG